MKREYRLFLKDIITACEDIKDFIEGMQYRQFVQDKKTNSAVIRQFEIMGEAAKHIPASTRVKYGRVPWNEIAGMRDRLIHGYFGVDYQLVWDTIQTKIPELEASIREILDDLDKNDD